jgi:hypothetical protein
VYEPGAVVALISTVPLAETVTPGGRDVAWAANSTAPAAVLRSVSRERVVDQRGVGAVDATPGCSGGICEEGVVDKIPLWDGSAATVRRRVAGEGVGLQIGRSGDTAAGCGRRVGRERVVHQCGGAEGDKYAAAVCGVTVVPSQSAPTPPRIPTQAASW